MTTPTAAPVPDAVLADVAGRSRRIIVGWLATTDYAEREQITLNLLADATSQVKLWTMQHVADVLAYMLTQNGAWPADQIAALETDLAFDQITGRDRPDDTPPTTTVPRKVR